MQIPVSRPIRRNPLRRRLGREFYIVKRRLQWWFGRGYVRVPRVKTMFGHLLVEHQSLILRPLKDVDMRLQHNKATNLKLAIARINGMVIGPKDSFSLWKLVGRPTARKGYLEGLVLSDGRVTSGIGGGLCQLGNLIYWMLLHTPLTVTERHRHCDDVFPDVNRSIPFGCGATLAYNYIDLGFRNDTQSSFSLHLWITNGYLHGEIRSLEPPRFRYEVYEADHAIRSEYWGAYTRHNKIFRKKRDLQTGVESHELMAVNHAIMTYNPLLNEHPVSG